MKYFANAKCEMKFTFFICRKAYFIRVAYFIAKLFHLPQANFIEKRLFFRIVFFLEAPPRFELGIKVLQTSALPLGYGAIYEKA